MTVAEVVVICSWGERGVSAEIGAGRAKCSVGRNGYPSVGGAGRRDRARDLAQPLRDGLVRSSCGRAAAEQAIDKAGLREQRLDRETRAAGGAARHPGMSKGLRLGALPRSTSRPRPPVAGGSRGLSHLGVAPSRSSSGTLTSSLEGVVLTYIVPETRPKVAELLEAAEEDLLAFLPFPAVHWVEAQAHGRARGQRRDRAANRRCRHLPQRPSEVRLASLY